MILRRVSWNAGRRLTALLDGRARLCRAVDNWRFSVRLDRVSPYQRLSPRGFLALSPSPCSCLRFASPAKPSFSFRRAQRSPKNAGGQIAHGLALELSRGPPRAFFPAVSTVAEQFRHRLPPTKEVHLEPVRLFFGAWFGVDATNVLFRVGISSFFHGSCA